MNHVDHLSYSSISLYNSCARAWRYRYLDKVHTPTNSNLLFGAAFHDCIEAYLEMRASGQGEWTLADLWHSAWESNREKTPDVLWQDTTPDELYKLGKRMITGSLEADGNPYPDLATFLNTLKPALDPHSDNIMTEVPVTLTLPGLPPVIGYVDMITADGVPCDFKTSARTWSVDKADSELQPTFYLAALNQTGQQQNHFRYYIFTKSAKPKVQVVETIRTAAQMLWLCQAIAEVWQAIQAGAFPPTGAGSWKCSPEYCEYWQRCQR